MKIHLFLFLCILLPSIDSSPRRFDCDWSKLFKTLCTINIGLVDLVPPPVQAGVDLVEADGPPVVGHLGEVNGSTDWSTLGRVLAPMAQGVWEVAALWLQNPSLGDRTAHLGGGLLGRQHLDMEQAGEPLFPVELASRTRICLQFHASIKMSPGIKAKGSPRRHLGLE